MDNIALKMIVLKLFVLDKTILVCVLHIFINAFVN